MCIRDSTDTLEKMIRRLRYDLFYLEHRSWGCLLYTSTADTGADETTHQHQ